MYVGRNVSPMTLSNTNTHTLVEILATMILQSLAKLSIEGSSDYTAMGLRAHAVRFGNEMGTHNSANIELFTHVHMNVHEPT